MRRIASVMLVGLIATVPALAFPGRTPADSAPHQNQDRPPLANYRASNIRLDVKLIDTYAGADSTKTVSLVLRNGGEGMIRTQNVWNQRHPVQLNLDASVQIVASDKLQINLTFEYTPTRVEPSTGQDPNVPAQLNESLSVYLTSGQSLVVSQSADPVTDRRVTVELTATVLD